MEFRDFYNENILTIDNGNTEQIEQFQNTLCKNCSAGLMLADSIRLTLIFNTPIWYTFEDIQEISQRVTVCQLTVEMNNLQKSRISMLLTRIFNVRTFVTRKSNSAVGVSAQQPSSDESGDCLDAISRSGLGVRRQWKFDKLNGRRKLLLDVRKAKFRICSYNVLSQTIMERTMHLYRNCQAENLLWQNRWQRLSMEFDSIDADLFCLQEVQDMHYGNYFMQFFADKGFGGLYKRRTGTKPDGCAIFWRLSRFSLVSHDAVDYHVPNSTLDRDNVGLIASLRLQDGDERQRLVVANTHLLYNCARGDIKLGQLALLLAHLQLIAGTGNGDGDGDEPFEPLLLCGDLNSTPQSPLISLLKQGKLRLERLHSGQVSGQGSPVVGPLLRRPLLPAHLNIYEPTCTFQQHQQRQHYGNPAVIGHRIPLKSSYKFPAGEASRWISFLSSCDSAMVDHIFYASPRLHCIRYCSLLSRDQVISSVGFLPNAYCGSDHLPVISDFYYFFK
ncbi:Protein angel -like protein 2 [Trichinella papuae]|uniref:Protein angel-like protein 2 n=1 Tax=Trichinella papuae TaxID=268474 RepID=A0A0V1MVX8_9BILA|nr:Protein angel -like protein 2 [Trichinella papuae]